MQWLKGSNRINWSMSTGTKTPTMDVSHLGSTRIALEFYSD